MKPIVRLLNLWYFYPDETVFVIVSLSLLVFVTEEFEYVVIVFVSVFERALLG